MLEDDFARDPTEGTEEGLPDVTAFLNSDPQPTFIIPIDLTKPIPFRIRFANHAFLNDEQLQSQIATDDATAIAFRSWAQAVAHWRYICDFGNQSWNAFSLQGKWKVMRMIPISNTPRPSQPPLPVSTSKNIDLGNLQREASMADAQLKSLRRMMDMSDVGVFEYDLTGTLIRGNESWYKLSNHPRDMIAHQDFSFMELVYPEDAAFVISQWNTLVQKEPVTFEMRWKAPPRPSPTNPEVLEDFQWVLSACVPVLDDAGELVSIAGNTIDISAQKRMQEVQRRRVEEAMEAKRQAQNFIDMTSHEMRNPLSAIIQCSDSSIESLHHISEIYERDTVTEKETARKEIKACLDALETIISCSLHQKRVVDDILTLSKLDSNLILITPVRVEPVSVAQEGIKIVSLECVKDDIDLEFREDPSLLEAGAGWAMMDSSRFLQILLNLLTNAIKFTRNRMTKNITVKLGAAPERPSEIWNGITFASSRNNLGQDIIDEPDWGNGSKAYLWVAVEDTGVGLTPEEESHLFTRFSQATPRTHITYGGSGLGLFISKSLAEMHGGGCIGVRSQTGVGSTFAFFIGIRVAEEQANDDFTRRPTLKRQQSIEARVKNARYSVLLVEDNLINQKVLAQQLQRAGCIVYVAGNGQEALDFLTTTRFWRGQEQRGRDLSIVLMDIEMPIMDGITACKRIRELQSSGEILSHVPIVSVSANARSEQVASARDAGMDDSISKPFRIPELLPKIEVLAKRWE